MTNTDDFITRYKRHEEALSKANTSNKGTVFAALAKEKITSVTVTFDGEGDSGQMENITAYRESEACDLPPHSITFVNVTWDEVRPCERQLYEAIESLCYDYLSQLYEGWENNDGAFGEFTFDVAEREIELEFNARFSDFIPSSHTL